MKNWRKVGLLGISAALLLIANTKLGGTISRLPVNDAHTERVYHAEVTPRLEGGTQVTVTHEDVFVPAKIKPKIISYMKGGLLVFRVTHTYFSSFTDGSNSNNGTAKATPFKGIPQKHPLVADVNGCTLNCSTAGAGLGPGDTIVLKGSDTWDSNYLIGVYVSGSSGSPITYTVDQTWYVGGAWAKPVFDANYVNGVIIGLDSGIKWISIDHLELEHLLTTQGNGEAMIQGVGNSHIVMDSLYLHGWKCPGCTTNNHAGAISFSTGSISPASDAQTNTLSNSTIENTEGSGTILGGSVGQAVTFIGQMTNVDIHDVASAVVFVWDYNGGTLYNIGYPNANHPPDCSGSNDHCNGIYQDGGIMGASSSYLRNLVMHDVGAGSNALYPNSNGNQSMYIYNNILYGVLQPTGAINIDTYTLSGQGGDYHVYNNTMYMADASVPGTDCILIDTPGTNRPLVANLYIKNNQCIDTSTPTLDNATGSNVSGTISRLTNSTPTVATAEGEGYDQANLWAPIYGNGSTVKAGTDLSAYFTTDVNGDSRAAPFDIGAYQHQPTTYIGSLSTNTPAGSDSNTGTLAAPFATLQHCFEVLAAGDQCQVRAGTYNQGFLNIGTGYTNAGTDFGDNQILVKPYNGETVVFRHNSEKTILTFHGGAGHHDHLYWHIQDIDFDGSTGYYPGSGTSGSLVDGDGDYIWVEGGRIHHGVNNGMQPEGAYWLVTDAEIDHNGTVVNTDGIQYHGIYAGGQHLTFDGNDIHDNYGSGIQIFQSGANDVSFNIVRNNRVYHNDQYDPNCGCYEISVGTGEGNLVYNNIVYNFVIGAIQLDYRCGLYGVPCAAYQNTIYSTSNRIGIRVGSDNLGTIIKNNIIRVASGTDISDLGSMTVANHNLLKSTDPLFTNVGSSDFTLTMSSPAIGAGADLSSLCTGDNIALCSDFDGVARGTTPDYGAYQYAAGTPASISQLSPSTGAQGTLVVIAVTGSSTNFSNGSTVCTVSGSDIVIVGTTASSATAGICTITIGSSAAVGTRDVTMTTGGEVATASGGFTVTLANSRQFQLFRIH